MCSRPPCPRSHHGYRHSGSPDTHSVLKKGRQCGVPRTHTPVFPKPLHAAMGKPEPACKSPVQAAASTKLSEPISPSLLPYEQMLSGPPPAHTQPKRKAWTELGPTQVTVGRAWLCPIFHALTSLPCACWGPRLPTQAPPGDSLYPRVHLQR